MKKRLAPKKNDHSVNFAVHVEQIEENNQTELFKLHVSNEAGLQLTVMLDGVDPEKLPVIEIVRANAQQLREYNRSTKQAAVQGFQIKLNDVPAYGIFAFADGSFKQDNLFDIMITAVGNARQSEGMTRAMIDRAQRYAHDVKRNIATYNHFYGSLTDEQKAWMQENTVSYEHEMQVAKEAAKLRNGGN